MKTDEALSNRNLLADADSTRSAYPGSETISTGADERSDAPSHDKSAASDSGFFSSLSLPDYRTLWLSSSGNFFAQQMQIVAKGYLAYIIGNSATALGSTSVAHGFTMLSLALVGGAFADRVNKRNLVIVSQALSGLSALIIALLVATGRIELWHLIVASVFQGFVFSFNMPARQAMVPEIVGKNRLTNALALNSIGANLSRVLAPSIAGFAIALAFIGTSGAYFMIAAMFAIVSYISLKLPNSQPNAEAAKEPLLTSIKGGLSFVRQSPYLMALLLMAFIPVTLGMPYQALLPAFNDRALAGGPEALGLLYMTIGVGSLIGSFFVATTKTMRGKARLQILAGTFFGVGLAAVGLTRDVRAAMLLLLVTGACSQCYMTINNTFVLSSTPREYYGRVMSIYQLTFAIMPIATFPISILADVIGISTTFVLCGSAMAILMAGVALLNPGGARQGPRLESEQSA